MVADSEASASPHLTPMWTAVARMRAVQHFRTYPECNSRALANEIVITAISALSLAVLSHIQQVRRILSSRRLNGKCTT